LGLLNTVAINNIEAMEGTEDEKNAILGDMHFLRALVNFDLNNYFLDPSTGYSIPLVFEPIGVNDRVSCSPTQDVREAIEQDIETARNYFDNVSGEANYYAATALAARIYFFHKKYALAYERANELIEDSDHIIEKDAAAPFVPGGSSRENIFSFKYNPADGNTPTDRIAEAYRALEGVGFYVLNPESEAAKIVLADTSDNRYKAFYTPEPSVTYINKKYSTNQMDYIYIRHAEMYLTRAEANIMVNNNVSQQDVDDINILRERANASTVLSSIPSVTDALDILFEDRIKELAFESGDHYLNVRRLEKGIIKIPVEGTGMKSYSEYAGALIFPFPDTEIKIHGLSRNP
jgi:hypothetical protein